MERKVKLSKWTERKLENLLEYLENEWSTKVKNDFVIKLDKVIAQIKVNPKAYPQSANQNEIHKCTVTKQTTIYYRYDESTIYIVTLFDNRQDPKRLEKEMD